MNHIQQAQEKIKDILGLEVSPDGEENFFLIKDEDGNVLEGMDFSDEVDALTDLLAQTIKATERATEERIVGEIEKLDIQVGSPCKPVANMVKTGIIKHLQRRHEEQ